MSESKSESLNPPKTSKENKGETSSKAKIAAADYSDLRSHATKVNLTPSSASNQHLSISKASVPECTAWSSFRDVVKRPAPAVPAVAAVNTVAPTSKPSEDYFDFPFITDEVTKQYLSQKGTKVMIIMRGAPGSGKSTLRAHIISSLDSVNVRTASADHYWMRDGEYVFDHSRLSEAHEFCRAECEKWCRKDDTAVVIIDNTNVALWEFTPYLRMANRFNFVVLLVEPKTPWKYNPYELLRRNIHKVPMDGIQKKCKSLQEFIFPMYYGWFINSVDSVKLRSLGIKLSTTILQLDEINMLMDANPNPFALQFSKRSDDAKTSTQKEDLLHCTCFYTGFKNTSGARIYGNREVVQNNIGKKHDLNVVGFLVTQKTISFRVKLNKIQLELWNNDDRADSRLLGAKAHITIATKNGVPAVDAGSEMRDVGRLQLDEKPETIVSTAAGNVSIFQNGFWYLDLEKSFCIPSLFGCFYGSGDNLNSASQPTVQ